jgi:hypothetical protein
MEAYRSEKIAASRLIGFAREFLRLGNGREATRLMATAARLGGGSAVEISKHVRWAWRQPASTALGPLGGDHGPGPAIDPAA